MMAGREQELLDLVERENIALTYDDLLPHGGRHGIYYFLPDVGAVIVLDRSTLRSDRLHTCVLAEELGHHMTAARREATLRWNYSLDLQEGRDEVRALKWATEFLCPTPETIGLIRSGNIRSAHDLAEHFEVTQWLAWRKLAFLQSESGAESIRDKPGIKSVRMFGAQFTEEAADMG